MPSVSTAMDALRHFDLLRRYDRALNLLRSIEDACTSGMKVLDAGCGMGLLSYWAIKSGATRVVAVDTDGIRLAKDIAQENGFSGSVDFIECDLWDLELPEERNRFDLILGMVYLNDPRRDEHQSSLVYSLRDRFLSTGGELIPDKVRYTVRACDWPSQDHATRSNRIRESIRELEGRYDMKLAPLYNAIDDECWKAHFPIRGTDGRLVLEGGKILSDPVNVTEIDYHGEMTLYPGEIRIRIAQDGVFNAIIWTQELLYKGRLLFLNESVSWLKESRLVRAGENCKAELGSAWREKNVVRISTQ